jgi:5-methylthioadenosine/S-adenosylhomocysteine deaminase
MKPLAFRAACASRSPAAAARSARGRPRTDILRAARVNREQMTIAEHAELLIEARWLLPVAPLNVALADHAVAIAGGRIAAVGPAAQLRGRFAGAERVVRARHALLPGLVNAHTTACHTLLRGLPVRGPRRRWFAEVLAPAERRCLSADFVRDGTRLGVAEMLRAGITCFADLSLLPEEAARAAAAAHVRAAIALPVADGATPWAEGATAHLARAERLWDEYRADARVSLFFAPLPAYGVSEATLARVRRVADELDARSAIHLADLEAACESARLTAPGVEDVARPPSQALRWLHRLGMLRPGFTAIGAQGTERAELELALRHGVSLVACPQAELRLRGGAPLPSTTLTPTALGTDTPLAAGALDVLAEMRVAALLLAIPAAEALRAATLGGATALGLQAEIGSLEPGKAADLACVDLGAAAAEPAAAIPDALVFGVTRGQISDVWSCGRLAVSAGRLLGFEAEELAAVAARWADRTGLEVAA